MAQLEFETVNINFSNVRGTQRETRTVSFGNTVERAEVAVQGFLFDFVSADNNLDRIQVRGRRVDTAGNDVEVEATVIVADRTRDDDYNATVNLVIIAVVA
jgi:hypothetical protein